MIPNRIARLNFNGSTDTSFDPGAGLDAEGICVNLDAAGQVVAGGSFNMVSGSVRSKLAVFDVYGELVTGTPTPSATVRTLATQTSGEILLGGDFTTIDGTNRNRIARVLPDLSLEAGFNPNALGPVHALALQTDGKILAGGSFNTIGGTTRNNVARLYNGVASDRLYATSAELIRWDRTGANEKTQRVTFELDTGSGYSPLAGTISQISTGWQIIPSTPLSGATNNVRATSFPSDSHSGGSHQIVASIPVTPDIAVSINTSPMTDGSSTFTFPSLQVGATSTATVTISNVGLEELTLTSAVTIDGQWEIVAQPVTSIPSLTSVSFAIRFKPTSEGAKTGTLSIFSDDPDEGTFTVNLSGQATVGSGGLDLTWQPNADRRVHAFAKSSDNNLWLGGEFTRVKASIRPRLAFINKDAVIQEQAANIIPATDTGYARCIAQLPDGTALVGGSLSSKNLYWVGFSPTGGVTLKASFVLATNPVVPSINPVVNCMAVEADGSVLVGGWFGGIKIGTASTTKTGTLFRLRFSPAGVVSVDTNFSANITDREVLGIVVQTDGKIILCNGPGAASSAFSEVVRIKDTGVPDSTFSATARGIIRVALDAQGRVLVGGPSASIAEAPAFGVSRLSSLGELDETFTLVPSAALSLLPMTDSTLVVASGSFGQVASASRLEKFLTDGSPDASFIAAITGSVITVCSQEDGALLIGGDFRVASLPLTTARIINSPTSTSLTVIDSTRVQWLRSGALPEAQIVLFDVSQDNGATWIRFGQGQRISGGWQLTGIHLPFSGILRARAYIQSAGNSSIMEEQVSFSGLNVSDLIVQVPGTEIVADNGQASTVTAVVGSTLPVIVTLVNTGLAEMTDVKITVTPITPLAGGEARWEVGDNPNGTIVAGGSTTATIRFKPLPADRGLISATLSITSSVPGLKNPYLITLVGAAVTSPIALTKAVTLQTSGDVTFNGSFTPNDYNATAYFRYGLKSAPESSWVTTSPMSVSGFGTAQNLIKAVSGLSIGATYTVRAYITNSSNVTSPAAGSRVDFVPQL